MTKPINRMFWVVAVLIGAASYGILSPYIKLAYGDGWNEVQITISQMVLGTIILWLVVLLRPKAWMNPLRAPWIKLTFIGFFGLALTTVFLNSSLVTLNASLAIILLFQFTWITIVLESILLKKWPTRFQLISVTVIMIGTLLAVGLSTGDLSGIDPKGFFFALGSAFTYSIFLTFTGRIQTDMDAVLKSALMLTCSLPFAIPLMFFLFPQQVLFQEGVFSLEIGSLLFWGVVLGLLGPVIPTILFNLGIPKIGSSLAAMLGSIELPVAIVGSYFILHEWVTLWQWLGVFLIIMGIVIAEKKSAGR